MFYDITKFILCNFILEIHKFLCHYKFNFMSQNLKTICHELYIVINFPIIYI